VEQLARLQRLGDAVRVVQGGQLLMPGFRVDRDHVAVFQLGDEGQRVPDGTCGPLRITAYCLSFAFNVGFAVLGS
jgi:hypothetical protein